MSRIFSKFVAVSNVNAQKVADFAIEADAIRHSKEEIEIAKQNLAIAKQDLAEISAKEVEYEQKIQRLRREFASDENCAIEALKNNDESAVEELAEKLAALHQQIATEQTAKNQYSDHASRLEDLIKKFERTILEYERELAMTNTANSVYKITKSVIFSHTLGSTRSHSAKVTLDRIKQRQKAEEQRWAAEEKLEKTLRDGSVSEKTQAGSFNSNKAKNIVLQRIHELAGK